MTIRLHEITGDINSWNATYSNNGVTLGTVRTVLEDGIGYLVFTEGDAEDVVSNDGGFFTKAQALRVLEKNAEIYTRAKDDHIARIDYCQVRQDQIRREYEELRAGYDIRSTDPEQLDLGWKLYEMGLLLQALSDEIDLRHDMAVREARCLGLV